ncbi:uncharacterized protein IUM83_03561 [Phytophthora cinnamomi]|uniref:uncharacterized protein n=2 Tax=Phytophthora cinnamomi TaxID=4785 RepID=UPI003559A198|nr:hypothetical protein IUM83_03561 [Phytophthora cinnamomi]
MADGRRLRCDQELLLDLELMTMAGQVSLRSVPCLVLRGDGDELLLGRDVLKGLGIDVEEQLAQLAEPALLDSENDEFSVGDELPFAPQPINSLDELLDCAVGNGLPEEHVGAVRALLDEFPDIWRDAVGADLPADVEPLRVTLRPDAVPHRSAPRKYAPLQAAFIRDYVKALVDGGLIEQNNSARWACAVVPVRKPGTQDKFRLTIDYRPVNSVTVPIAGTMPSAAIQADAFQGKKIFARFDFTQGFWQLPLHEDSREIFSFVTPDGVYTPTRVPQGAMDSALHFQSQVQAKLAPLIPHSALVWVDDVILFAPTIAEFLQTLRTFFEIVSAANFKLNRTKSSLLSSRSSVADLQYFVCATNWLHDSLPDYARTIAPLQDKLNDERTRIGRRSRNALNVPTTWSPAEEVAFKTVVSLVKDSAPMAFPDPDAQLLLFTDASATGYSIILTQVRDWDASLPVDEQHHEMIICKGGLFKHSELNWTVVEKRLIRLLKPVKISNISCFALVGSASTAIMPTWHTFFAPSVELKKHVRDRLQRWAMRLCGLHYIIEHIPGEKNVWADIVSRWHAREIVAVAAVQTRSRHIVPVEELSPLRPLADEQFIFPKRADLHAAQLAASRERSRLQHASEEEDGVVTVDNRPWVPTNAKDLLARIFVVAHCGSQGHRGQDAMALVLKERFYTVNLDDKVAKFVRQCLLCKHFKGPRQIPRPYGPLLTPTQRNEVVHWDFLSLGDGFGDSKYLLVVKDGISHFCELFPCATPTAYVAAESLTLWYARYGLPQTLKSDQGTHFRNEMVKHLAARLKMELHFTPVYSPWLNGTIERLNKDVLQVLRALLMEYGLDQHEWPYLLPAIQANLNHTPVPSLAGHAPVEVFTGLPASSALDVIVVPAGSEHAERVVDLDDIGGFVGQLRSSLHAIHQDVSDAKERQRLRDMASHKGIPVNFDVGDFVLWSRIDQRLPNNKLLGHWVGPFKVVAALAHSFEIEHLVTGRKYDVHASRLKFYADAELDTTAELLELVSSQGMLLGVEKLVDHRYNHDLNRWELFVSWAGLQAIENSWEPLITLLHDVPAKVREYIDAAEDDELSAQID